MIQKVLNPGVPPRARSRSPILSLCIAVVSDRNSNLFCRKPRCGSLKNACARAGWKGRGRENGYFPVTEKNLKPFDSGVF